MYAQVLFAILLAALGIAQAQMSFPDITQAGAAIERVFGTIDRKTAIDSSSDAGAHCLDHVVLAGSVKEGLSLLALREHGAQVWGSLPCALEE